MRIIQGAHRPRQAQQVDFQNNGRLIVSFGQAFAGGYEDRHEHAVDGGRVTTMSLYRCSDRGAVGRRREYVLGFVGANACMGFAEPDGFVHVNCQQLGRGL